MIINKFNASNINTNNKESNTNKNKEVRLGSNNLQQIKLVHENKNEKEIVDIKKKV